MQPDIVSAVIGGVSTIAASVIAVIISLELSGPNYQTIGSKRTKRIQGKWKGQAYQDRGPEGAPIEFGMSIEFRPGRKLVMGVAVVDFPYQGSDRQFEFDVKGGFLHDQFIRVNYVNRDTNVIQFGAMVLKVSPDGSCLTGSYVGYGALSDAIITGTVSMKKQS